MEMDEDGRMEGRRRGGNVLVVSEDEGPASGGDPPRTTVDVGMCDQAPNQLSL